MVKTEVVNYIYQSIGLQKKIAVDSVEGIIEAMKETLSMGENIQIVGFGRFNVKTKKDRVGRDPSTGREIVISARKVLSFRPSRHLKEAVK